VPDVIAVRAQIQVFKIGIVVPDVNDLFLFFGTRLVRTRNVLDARQRRVVFGILVHNVTKICFPVYRRVHDGQHHVLVRRLFHVTTEPAKVLDFVGIVFRDFDVQHVFAFCAKGGAHGI